MHSGMSSETRETLMDFIEKYLMTRLYRAVFCPVTTDDEEKDLEIQTKIRRYVQPSAEIQTKIRRYVQPSTEIQTNVGRYDPPSTERLVHAGCAHCVLCVLVEVK